MPVPDAELARAVRESGRHGRSAEEALEELYRRHCPAVLAYARTCCRDRHTAEDLASEAFARTLHAVRAGRGPDSVWRPYLLSVVRRTAADWALTARRTDLSPDFEHWWESAGPSVESGEDKVLRREEGALVARGFRDLPERWQAVLWHTAVEGESAERIGALLGISPSGVGSLAARAREGLREAYLAAYAASAERPECVRHSRALAAAIRRPGRRLPKDLARHLDDCTRCRAAMTELADLNGRMRSVLPVALLMWAPTAHFASRLAGQGAAAGTAGVSAPLKAAATPLGMGVAAGAAALAALGAFALLPGSGGAPPAGPKATAAATASAHVAASPRPARPATETARPPAPPRTATSRRPVTTPVTRLRIKATGECMGISAGAGAEPREAGCDGSPGQAWGLVRSADGRVQLRNQASGLCLTYPDRLPDGAVVRQFPCAAGARGQWWDYQHSQQKGDMILSPAGDTLRRLGLNDWHAAEQGGPHSRTIGVTPNYYGTASLVLLFDGEPFGPA
jgi:RNA polymerase sigma factor (sigma-70 family)